MTTFEAFYGSFAQQPVLLWGAAAVGLAVVAARRGIARSARSYCIAFGLVPFFDAWLTADRVAGVGALGATAGVVLGSFFAIVGDYRVFLFLSAATPEGEIAVGRGNLFGSALWSLAVPIAAAVVHGWLPDEPWRGRATFLFYEVSFLAVMGAWALFAKSSARAWTRLVLGYVVAYYALWALADVAILFGELDVGYLVRIVANVLYYGGLLAVVSLSAPPLGAKREP